MLDFDFKLLFTLPFILMITLKYYIYLPLPKLDFEELTSSAKYVHSNSIYNLTAEKPQS